MRAKYPHLFPEIPCLEVLFLSIKMEKLWVNAGNLKLYAVKVTLDFVAIRLKAVKVTLDFVAIRLKAVKVT
jgi:hypothetical protein